MSNEKFQFTNEIPEKLYVNTESNITINRKIIFNDIEVPVEIKIDMRNIDSKYHKMIFNAAMDQYNKDIQIK